MFVTQQEAEEHISRYFLSLGMTERAASLVAASLVDAEMRGHGSHGLLRIREYTQAIASGLIAPSAEPILEKSAPAVLNVKAQNCPGQLALTVALEAADPITRQLGICVGTIQRCGHVGRLGWYAEALAHRGLATILMVNGGAEAPRMAPFGAKTPFFGTNPICFAFPVQDSAPFVADFSTAAVAAGKLRLARERGETIPPGYILDKFGNPSQNPEDYARGGMLLPFGGHKGSALAFVVEYFAGLLSATGALGLLPGGLKTQNGVFFAAFQPSAFAAGTPIHAAANEFLQAARKCAGPQNRLFTPGEVEELAYQSASGKVEIPTDLIKLLLDSQK